MKIILAGLCAGLLLAPWALAQDADSIKAAVGAPRADSKGQVAGDLNFGQIGEDWYATLNATFTLDLGKVAFGIQAPLHFLVIDNDPENSAIGGILREEDWDEFSDYLKIIRFFRFGHKGDFIFAQVGDLPGAVLGHGTIVNRYYNNSDLNHYKMGLQFDLNTDYGGMETLVNGVAQFNLFGARAYIRPWSFVDPDAYLNNLAVGFTLVADVTAPYALAYDTTQTPAVPIVEDNLPKVAEAKAATAMGGDIEFRLLHNDVITLTPYLDMNGILGAGAGLHVGILNTFHIPVISLDLSARIEYRYFTADYIPAYFDSFYEIQKFAYPVRDVATNQDAEFPKRAALEHLGEKGLNGYYAELIFDFLGLVQLGASYDDYDGLYNSNLRIYLNVPALEVFKFGAYYYKHNFEGADQAFTFDEKSLFLVEAKYQVSSFLYLVGQFWRIWKLDEDPNSDTYGTYQGVNDWSVGFGFSYQF